MSCQHYANGLYYAHRHLAQENTRLRRASRRLHLRRAGDQSSQPPASARLTRSRRSRTIGFATALYKSDPDLRAVHAAFPWIVTWDDHETENDYAGFTPENPADPADNQPDFASRRARAYQAYYEHMPLRAAQLPIGPYLQLYRRLRFGSLLSVNVLDTRQYRSHRAPANCALDRAHRRLLPERARSDADDRGRRRSSNGCSRAWHFDGRLEPAGQPGAVRARTTPMPTRRCGPSAARSGTAIPVDRQQILDFMQQRQLGNTVVITGDVHANFVRNVPPDHVQLDAEPVATEFIGTSISTGGDRTLSTVFGGNANNPHLQFSDNHHGYVRCRSRRNSWRADYRVVPTVIEPVDGGISTLASFVVEAGQAGAVQA